MLLCDNDQCAARQNCEGAVMEDFELEQPLESENGIVVICVENVGYKLRITAFKTAKVEIILVIYAVKACFLF